MLETRRLLSANETLVNVQPSEPLSVYVDDDWAGLAPGVDPDGNGPATAIGVDAFAMIQAAVAASDSGTTVHVAAGTYHETVEVAKELKLLGAQAGVDARNGARGDETIVNAPGAGLSLRAYGVVIDGFTVQGSSNQPSAVGIETSPLFGGYQILNNIIRDNEAGLDLQADGVARTVVQFNWFHRNNGEGVASGIGIRSAGPLQNALIDSNRFTEHDSAGLELIGEAISDVQIAGNDLPSNRNGIILQQTSHVDVSANSIRTTFGHGVHVSASNDHLRIIGNTITDVAPNGAAINFGGINGLNTNVVINQNFLTDNWIAIAVSNLMLGDTLDARFNDFSGSGTAIFAAGFADVQIDARFNWFGVSSQAVYDKLDAPARHKGMARPWLGSGVDTDVAPGFQPDLTNIVDLSLVLVPRWPPPGSQLAIEGELYSVSLVTAPDITLISATIDWGDGTIESVPGNVANHVYQDGPNGYTVRVSIVADWFRQFEAMLDVHVLNSAPQLEPSGAPFFDPVERNNRNSAGTSIRDLLARGANGDPIHDPGADPEGIAIVAAASDVGSWEFSLDDGSAWVALGAVSESNARLLAADERTRLRLVPTGTFEGPLDSAIVFRAWDQDQGVSGGTFDIAANGSGGTTSFSTALEQALQLVTPPLDVSAIVVDGSLFIEGDEHPNVVTISGIGVGTGHYRIQSPQGVQFVSGVSGSMAINLRGSDDSLTIDNAYVNGAIDIQMGEGGDVVMLGNQDVVSTRGDLRIDLGGGNDRLDGKRLYIGANQIIHAGEGDDLLLFNGLAAPQFTLGTSAAGNVSWFTGPGDDTVNVVYGFIVGHFTVDLNSGHDSLRVFGSAVSGQVQLFGGSGIDHLDMDTNFCVADLLLAGNEDNDVLRLSNGLGPGIVRITSEGGADSITVRNQQAGSLHVDSGAGNDTFDVRGSAFDSFFALLGDDDDSATVHGNLSRLVAEIDGGLGNSDRLLDMGNSFFAAYRKRRFETFA